VSACYLPPHQLDRRRPDPLSQLRPEASTAVNGDFS
jgi:hypothetical protein